MKIYYVANGRMPTIKAHGLQIIRMCEAFAKIGLDCELVIPKRYKDPNVLEDNILEYYDVKKSFKITELKSPDFIYINLGGILNKFLFWVQQLAFAFALKKYLSGKEEGMVYSRDQFAISVLDSEKYDLYWEAHNFPKNIKSWFYKKVLKKIKGLVVISEGLNKDFSKFYNNNNIMVARDAVNVEEFNIKESKKEARKKLNLPLNKKIIIYTGHLHSWKGVNFLVDASKKFNEDHLFVFVGGDKKSMNKFDKSPNNFFVGHRPHRYIPLYLKAADCAVLTGKSSEDISEKYTSPLKLFEYMASGTPIVAQKLPSFMETLNSGNSVLVEADNADALARGIKNILNNSDLGAKISEQSLRDVQNKTWLERAEKIYTFIKDND